jgi:AraC-like DNA-binding protein
MDEIYSMQTALGASRAVHRRIRSSGLESFENEVFNSLNLALLGFGKVVLDKTFRHDDPQSFFNEMNVVLSGRGRLRFDGRELEMVPGRVYLFPAGGSRLAHRNVALQKIYFQFRAVVNGGELLRGSGPLSAPLPAALRRELVARHVRGGSPEILQVRADALRCLSLFSAPLSRLIRERREDFRRFEPFFQYVGERLQGEFSLADFGSRHGQRAKTFAAQFKKRFGEAPKKYFLREKLNRIKEALYYSDRTLGEISETFGFSDQYYFSRFFRKLTGMSPSDYRQSLGNATGEPPAGKN